MTEKYGKEKPGTKITELDQRSHLELIATLKELKAAGFQYKFVADRVYKAIPAITPDIFLSTRQGRAMKNCTLILAAVRGVMKREIEMIVKAE